MYLQYQMCYWHKHDVRGPKFGKLNVLSAELQVFLWPKI